MNKIKQLQQEYDSLIESIKNIQQISDTTYHFKGTKYELSLSEDDIKGITDVHELLNWIEDELNKTKHKIQSEAIKEIKCIK